MLSLKIPPSLIQSEAERFGAKTAELSNLHEVSIKSWFSSLRESWSGEQQAGAAGSGMSPRAAQTVPVPTWLWELPSLTQRGAAPRIWGCGLSLSHHSFKQSPWPGRVSSLLTSAASRTPWMCEGRAQDVYLALILTFHSPLVGTGTQLQIQKAQGLH